MVGDDTQAEGDQVIDKYAISGGRQGSQNIDEAFAARLRAPGAEPQKIGSSTGKSKKKERGLATVAKEI